VTTLHILRSKPDGQVRELIRVVTPGEMGQIALYEDPVDYDRLIDELFSHDRVICWW
jgi:hypothetical protein